MGGGKRQMSSERIEELERQIAELKRRWPAHSVPPAMLQQLDELEEELERERERVDKRHLTARPAARLPCPPRSGGGVPGIAVEACCALSATQWQRRARQAAATPAWPKPELYTSCTRIAA
jgi:hypothetical protein